MDHIRLYIGGAAPAMDWAAGFLRRSGFETAEAPDPRVTHLLLPVPSLDSQGDVRGGPPLQSLLDALPKNISILGGNLPDSLTSRYPTADFLQDPQYLAENAAITAHCALRLALEGLPVVIAGCPVLILGWGRIGKCLARDFRALGAHVTVAARNPTHRLLLHAMGFEAVDPGSLGSGVSHYRLLLNTIPAPVLSREQTDTCPPEAVLLDLASVPGMAGDRVVSAPGLPGRLAPESSGTLIGQTAARYLSGEVPQ